MVKHAEIYGEIYGDSMVKTQEVFFSGDNRYLRNCFVAVGGTPDPQELRRAQSLTIKSGNGKSSMFEM